MSQFHPVQLMESLRLPPVEYAVAAFVNVPLALLVYLRFRQLIPSADLLSAYLKTQFTTERRKRPAPKAPYKLIALRVSLLISTFVVLYPMTLFVLRRMLAPLFR